MESRFSDFVVVLMVGIGDAQSSLKKLDRIPWWGGERLETDDPTSGVYGFAVLLGEAVYLGNFLCCGCFD